jgi:hypothetical protein
MTVAQKKVNWTIGIIITILGLVWSAAAWATSNDTLDDQQSSQIEAATMKALEAFENSIENRTIAIIMSSRVDDLEERMDALEELQPLIIEIHQAVVEH